MKNADIKLNDFKQCTEQTVVKKINPGYEPNRTTRHAGVYTGRLISTLYFPATMLVPVLGVSCQNALM